MIVPLLLEQVRVKERAEILLVFRVDLAKQTADVFCPGSGIVERGVHWTTLEDAEDLANWPLAPSASPPPNRFRGSGSTMIEVAPEQNGHSSDRFMPFGQKNNCRDVVQR